MNPTILIPKNVWSVWDRIKGMQDTGWKHGRMQRAYVMDLADAQKNILLCPMCKHGFDWKKHGFYNVFHYDKAHAIGECDRCKTHSQKLELYLHERYRPQVWMTNDEKRAMSKTHIVAG